MHAAYPTLSGAAGIVHLDLRIQGAGASNPTTFKGANGHISSVTRTAPGRYTVTLDSQSIFPQMDSCEASVQDTNWATTPTHKTARLIAYSASARTLTFAVEEEGGYVTDEWTNGLAAAAAGLKAATATSLSVITWTSADLIDGGEAELAARPRNVTFTTAGGTPADAPATVVVTGTDVNGDALTETLNVPQTATIVAGVKAFKTITSVVFAVGQGTDATVSMGYGDVLGFTRKAKTRAGAVNVIREIAGGSYVTNGTFVVNATGLPNGTYDPNAALDGSTDFAVTYEVDAPVDLTSTQWLHVHAAMRTTSLGVT